MNNNNTLINFSLHLSFIRLRSFNRAANSNRIRLHLHLPLLPAGIFFSPRRSRLRWGASTSSYSLLVASEIHRSHHYYKKDRMTGMWTADPWSSKLLLWPLDHATPFDNDKAKSHFFRFKSPILGEFCKFLWLFKLSFLQVKTPTTIWYLISWEQDRLWPFSRTAFGGVVLVDNDLYSFFRNYKL